MPASSESTLTRGRVRYLPVIAGRLEFAMEVRRVLLAERPEVVAVELPVSLEDAYRKAVKRLPRISIVLYPDDANLERTIYVPVDPADPFAEAIRTAEEIGAQVQFIEPDLAARPHLPDRAPDPYAVRAIGYEKYVDLYRQRRRGPDPRVRAHAEGMAWKLQGADPFARIAVVLSLNMLESVLEAMEQPQEPPQQSHARREVEVVNAHPNCLAEILLEYPFLQTRYEIYRLDLGDAAIVDRPRVQLDLLREAERSYEVSTGDRMAHWHRRLIAKYTRNLAHIDDDLTAGVFDLAIAARSIVDDNFGYEVWQAANRYPDQREQDELETLNVSGDEVWLHTRKLQLRRKIPSGKKRFRPAPVKKRKQEKFPGEWAQQVNGFSICSYPPEDLLIEDYGRFLKKKAKSLLSEERSRTEPFTTSILDGIDIRETIRNWHDRQIHVKLQERVTGEVGSVVVIFDEDRDDRYPYLTTWLGEHQNESDMAYYSTSPFDHMVGPGIGRAEYGGFLMSLPPRRMFDIWADRDYDFADTKAERLLLAGLDYSQDKFVVYVAAKPPRSAFRGIAARMGQRILYVPVGQLSPAKMKKIRVVHVLDGHNRRSEAKDYIW